VLGFWELVRGDSPEVEQNQEEPMEGSPMNVCCGCAIDTAACVKEKPVYSVTVEKRYIFCFKKFGLQNTLLYL
jgi:hypothetical protein